MINWERWPEIEVVMLPERYRKDGLFSNMLSISVADFSVTLVGGVICGVKLRLYVPLLLLQLTRSTLKPPVNRVILFSKWIALSMFLR